MMINRTLISLTVENQMIRVGWEVDWTMHHILCSAMKYSGPLQDLGGDSE